MLNGVMAGGEASYFDDLPVTLERSGYTEECYFTFCYTPVHDEAGKVGGIFGTVSETTTRVVGWLVRDLVCHLVIDAQDVLITLVTPAETEPTCGAVIYWDVAETPPTGDDPLDALTVRLAAAYEEPRLLRPSR